MTYATACGFVHERAAIRILKGLWYGIAIWFVAAALLPLTMGFRDLLATAR